MSTLINNNEIYSLENAQSITDLIQMHVKNHGDRDAAILVRDPDKVDGSSHLTYQVLDQKAKKLAYWLHNNFDPGSRILLLYPVGLDFVQAFIACLYAGMVAVPAPIPSQHQHQRNRVKAIASDASISAILTDSTHLISVKEWSEAENLTRVDCISTDSETLESAEHWTLPVTNQSTIALLQYTSGSTGNPKGVMISQRNLLFNVASFARVLKFNKNTRFGGWIPLYHDMGLMAQLLPALFLGSTCVMMLPTTFLKRPHLWLRMIDNFNINHSCAPNFAFDLCSQRVTDEQKSHIDLSRLQHIISGSEPIQATTLNKFSQSFKSTGLQEESLCPCYGMAEATVFISGYSQRLPVLQNADIERLKHNEFKPVKKSNNSRQLVSCGAPRDYDVRIVEPKSIEVLIEGQIGEIWLRGESISRGYWRNGSATEETFNASTSEGDTGYLRTGDLGFMYKNEIYVTGRIKEMFIVNGRNHYPHDIEHEIRNRFSDLSNRYGAVFSVSSSNVTEALVITHEIQGRHSQQYLEVLSTKIKSLVQQEFGLNISAIVLLRPGSIKRTTSGKIQRIYMRELFLNKDLPSLYQKVDPSIIQVWQEFLATTLNSGVEDDEVYS